MLLWGLIFGVIEWLRKVPRGVEDAAPYTRNFIRQQIIKVVIIARFLGGVKTPPYSADIKGSP